MRVRLTHNPVLLILIGTTIVVLAVAAFFVTTDLQVASVASSAEDPGSVLGDTAFIATSTVASTTSATAASSTASTTAVVGTSTSSSGSIALNQPDTVPQDFPATPETSANMTVDWYPEEPADCFTDEAQNVFDSPRDCLLVARTFFRP